MNSNYLFEKHVGESTSGCITRLKFTYPEISDVRIGHLGTLDPMASGLMLFLIGDETKRFIELQKLKKTYKVTIVFGIETDSYDVLGMPEIWRKDSSLLLGMTLEMIEMTIKSFKGEIDQCPPPFSAIRINGKPLYWWYRNHRQNEINILPRKRKVYSINYGKLYNFDVSNFQKDLEIINNIKGDFRQNEIIEVWRKILPKLINLPAIDLEIECSSGTYIRSLVHDIGVKIGIPCIAYNIRRIAIGEHKI